MPLTVSQIAEQVRGKVLGDGAVELTGFASADCARHGDLTFAEKDTYFAAAEQSPAAAIIVSGEFTSAKKVLIRVPNTRVAVARVLPMFFPRNKSCPAFARARSSPTRPGLIPRRISGRTAWSGAGVRLGARSALLGGNHIGRDCQIGDDVCLFPNVVVYARSQIGHRVTIHASTVIGSDGYGYVFDEGRHRKMLQVGHVIIHDDVEIGANAAIDRGASAPRSSARARRSTTSCISRTT